MVEEYLNDYDLHLDYNVSLRELESNIELYMLHNEFNFLLNVIII